MLKKKKNNVTSVQFENFCYLSFLLFLNCANGNVLLKCVRVALSNVSTLK